MSFTGFGPGALDFLRGLAAENSKAFFDAHRPAYEREIRIPLEDLVDEAQERYGPGRVLRPNRDVRFAKDKSPYRTDASMMAGSVGGVYLSLSVDGLRVGGGLYAPTRDQLGRARHAIDTHRTAGPALRAAVDGVQAEGFELAGPRLRTAPRGYPREHPHIALLRLRHYAALRRLPADAAPERVWESWAAVEPLVAWTEAHAGPG